MAVPAEKRLILVDKLNGTERNWTFNDGDYTGAVRESFFSSLVESVFEGVKVGANIGGGVIGIPGAIVGGLVGAIVGGLRSLVVKPLSKFKPLKNLGFLAKLIK